jgi:hypothetical protein
VFIHLFPIVIGLSKTAGGAPRRAMIFRFILNGFDGFTPMVFGPRCGTGDTNRKIVTRQVLFSITSLSQYENRCVKPGT